MCVWNSVGVLVVYVWSVCVHCVRVASVAYVCGSIQICGYCGVCVCVCAYVNVVTTWLSRGERVVYLWYLHMV